MSKPLRTAVFPVAGFGTRFLPATKTVPKEMLPVVDKPLIHYAVEEARAAGMERFVFVTGRGKGAMENYFDHAFELERVLREGRKDEALRQLDGSLLEPGAAFFTRQQQALGLGHAVACAAPLIDDEPFAVILPDDLVLSRTPCLKQMVDAYQKIGGNIVAVMDVPREHTDRYGILDMEYEDGSLVGVRGLVEKPAPADAPSTLSIIGRYILQPEVFTMLERQEEGAGGEIQLTDAIARTIGRVPLHGLRFEGERFDCGNKAGYVKANVAFSLQRDDLREDVLAFLRESSG